MNWTASSGGRRNRSHIRNLLDWAPISLGKTRNETCSEDRSSSAQVDRSSPVMNQKAVDSARHILPPSPSARFPLLVSGQCFSIGDEKALIQTSSCWRDLTACSVVFNEEDERAELDIGSDWEHTEPRSSLASSISWKTSLTTDSFRESTSYAMLSFSKDSIWTEKTCGGRESTDSFFEEPQDTAEIFGSSNNASRNEESFDTSCDWSRDGLLPASFDVSDIETGTWSLERDQVQQSKFSSLSVSTMSSRTRSSSSSEKCSDEDLHHSLQQDHLSSSSSAASCFSSREEHSDVTLQGYFTRVRNSLRRIRFPVLSSWSLNAYVSCFLPRIR